MAEDVDPRAVFWITGSPEAMRAIARKDALLNEMASWMAYRHEDEIAEFVASCEDIEFTAAVMADVVVQASQHRGGGQL